MSESEQKSGGWANSLRRTGESILGLTQSRLELLAVELQEEKLRALVLVLKLGIALTLGAAGLLVVIGALGLFLWNAAGYWGLVALALITLGGAAGMLWTLRRQIERGPAPFADTVAEFRKDREWLRKTD
jgi:uncharacterized membrane protein YqjE